jgi:predicted alpha/beta superfamily hydrolase
MKENRPYMVYLPPSYEKSGNAYPVIYLLDGDIHRFKGFVGVLESLSSQTLENQVKEAIVIAIPNTNRSRDLTPSTLTEWTFKGRVLDTFDQTGNALNFATFLKTELIPHIENTYRASDKRVLVGESFGGLFASNVIVFTPTMFSDFLIIDPTALWDNDYLNRAYLANGKSTNLDINVFFAFANNSHLGEIGLTNYSWGSAFATSIIKHSNGIAKQQYFENESHGTVALLAWYNGLKALLPSEKNEH